MTLGADDRVVVVGAGLAGWRTCEEMRRRGYAGELCLVGDEVHAPYDRPPLSKKVLAGKWGLDHTTLATPERLAEARVDLVRGEAAVSLDPAEPAVTLGDGRRLSGSRVVIATGSRARRLSWHSELLHELRSRDDAARLSTRLDELSAGDTVAIIGGGFIGAEVATAVSARGLRAVVLEAALRPLVGPLGETVARWLERLPGDAGVELRTNQRVSGVEATGDGDAAVLFEDGSRVAARAVVVGVGARPNVEWLAGSGLAIDDGVIVDAHHLATPLVAAVGDVARAPYAGGVSRRLEHWQVATDQASALARWWALGEESPAAVPYFWSDQYGKKIQVLGLPGADDEVVRVKETETGQWLALYAREGLVQAAVALSQPRALMLSRPLLERPTTLGEALRAAPWS